MRTRRRKRARRKAKEWEKRAEEGGGWEEESGGVAVAVLGSGLGVEADGGAGVAGREWKQGGRMKKQKNSYALSTVISKAILCGSPFSGRDRQWRVNGSSC